LFEEIRREYEFGVGTVLGVAKKLGVHRRMVREALGNAVPARRKKPERKQRHTAHRNYQRLGAEQPGMEVAESTVRRYVREKKQALGLTRREICVPQKLRWGQRSPGGLV